MSWFAFGLAVVFGSPDELLMFGHSPGTPQQELMVHQLAAPILIVRITGTTSVHPRTQLLLGGR